MKGPWVALAFLLLAQHINAESKGQSERTEHADREHREIVEIDITEKKIFYIDTSFIGFYQHEAQSLCESMNMTLVKFETEAKWLAVSKWISDKPYSGAFYWTGAKRDANSTKWYWEATGAEMVFSAWGQNQPDSDISKESCMDIMFRDASWYDSGCKSYELNPICEL